MARIADKNSKRQKGYKILNKMKSKQRAVCLERLMEELEINKPYASTLYADHRKLMKDSGVYTTVYRILEKPFGRAKVMKPYVSKADVFKPKKSDHVTEEAAITAYVASNEMKTKTALGLAA